jgi:hypothetical protein
MVNLEIVENRLVEIRNKKVLLDRDVAALYGIETKRVNEAVKNNPDKFPDGYVIYLDHEETEFLRSKISTSEIQFLLHPNKSHNLLEISLDCFSQLHSHV